MDITVVWKDAEGNGLPGSFDAFVRGAVYQADITLTAKNGYAFDPEISFQYPEGTVEDQPVDDLSEAVRALSTVTYKPTEAQVYISTVDLTGYIPFPVTGGTPVISFYAKDYGGTVSWKAGDTAVEGLFQARTVYEAEVTLYPGPGYVFSHTGQVIYQGNITGTFTYVGGMILAAIGFPETEGGQGNGAVNDLDLTDKVPAPVTGKTPVKSVSGSQQYTGDAAWSPAHSAFQAGTGYTATVTLTAASGYTFTGAGDFTHKGASKVSAAENTGGSIKVSIVFPAGQGGGTPGNDVDVGMETEWGQ
jgi:hypothetical protein